MNNTEAKERLVNAGKACVLAQEALALAAKALANIVIEMDTPNLFDDSHGDPKED